MKGNEKDEGIRQSFPNKVQKSICKDVDANSSRMG